jgi:hypothetical protein
LVIGIDFDGTIVTEQWPKIGRLRWLAKKRINWMQHKRKHILVLVTCREGELLEQADRFLMDHGIFMDYLNKNTSEIIAQYGDCRKISVDLLLDNLAFFPGWLFVPVVVLWMEWRERLQKMLKNIVKEVTNL